MSDAPLPPFRLPSVADMEAARAIVESQPVISAYAACEEREGER